MQQFPLSSAVFDVWVPRPSTALGIDPRSAIVSSVAQDGQTHRVCDLEGNRLGADNLQSFPQRLLHAAGRAAQRYPTMGRAQFELTDLTHVGQFDLRLRRLIAITDHDALANYLSPEPVPVVLDATEARRRVEQATQTVMPTFTVTGPLAACLHRWTGKTRNEGGVELECVSQDGLSVEWVSGWPLPWDTTKLLTPALSALLNEHL